MLFALKFLLVILSAVIAVSCSLAITWIWLSYENIPNLITATHGLTFDYIIVGAGTSGSVLAHELSENRNISVLIIEAGHIFNTLSKVPLLATVLQKSKHDWQFLSEPQKHSSKGLINQMQAHPRGKGLGGTSQLNYMLHFSGNQKDFELWKDMGIKGWNMRTGEKRKISSSCSKITQEKWQDRDLNEKYSMRNEICYQSYNRRKKSDETNGIWSVPINYSRISEVFVETSSSIEAEQLVFKLAQYNIKNGRRWSVYEKFLRPCFERKNLKILSNTLVKKISLKGRDANGVIVQSSNNPSGQQLKMFSRNEIILSAGSYQSPQLLQISGIGPKHILDQIGVKEVFNSINVGVNLHDHFHLPLFVSINVSASMTAHKVLNLKEIFKYIVTGKGHFSNFGVIGFVTPKDDIFGVTIFGTGAINEEAFMSISNFEQEDFRSVFPLYHNASQEGFIMLSTCYQPLSRGYVKARTSKIEDAPHIDPNYLDNRNDLDCIIRGVRKAVEIVTTDPFRRINATIHWPKIKSCSNYGPFSRDSMNEPSDRYLKCIIRRVGLTGHHPGGTCSMGSGLESVLDTKLRVRGINHLRVVDASVLPTPLSGTPNSVLISMAKHAAKFILRQV